MNWRVRLTRRAERGLRDAPAHIQTQVALLLDVLSESPVPYRGYDLAKLKGLADAYRIRLGEWRVLYQFVRKGRIVLVYRIEARERAFE